MFRACYLPSSGSTLSESPYMQIQLSCEWKWMKCCAHCVKRFEIETVWKGLVNVCVCLSVGLSSDDRQTSTIQHTRTLLSWLDKGECVGSLISVTEMSDPQYPGAIWAREWARGRIKEGVAASRDVGGWNAHTWYHLCCHGIGRPGNIKRSVISHS